MPIIAGRESVDLVAGEEVRNFDRFKVVKSGAQVEVTYTEALALSVEPAASAPTKPK